MNTTIKELIQMLELHVKDNELNKPYQDWKDVPLANLNINIVDDSDNTENQWLYEVVYHSVNSSGYPNGEIQLNVSE
jgi:hypothetical protein|tara:strand:- start:102 stop:332 length:231 start_codon:yes stop_codon:yes gene_type:complete